MRAEGQQNPSSSGGHEGACRQDEVGRRKVQQEVRGQGREQGRGKTTARTKVVRASGAAGA
jgi:hypothetical protein